MEFLIEIAEPAEKDIDDEYLWHFEESPSRADKWFRGLFRAIFSLRNLPRRCLCAARASHSSRISGPIGVWLTQFWPIAL
jgi:plasmid stabilization system protein ParE